MVPFAKHIRPSVAARRLGVSAKALRLYERHGLIAPDRTATGWRAYSADDMTRAAEIVALRALGLSLVQVGRALKDDAKTLDRALAEHHVILQSRIQQLATTIVKVRNLRASLDHGWIPSPKDVSAVFPLEGKPDISFDLPWPWGGERFALSGIRPLNYITGPLGSGKTRLATRISATLPGAEYLGLERLDGDGRIARDRLAADRGLRSRVERALSRLVEDGASTAGSLVALLVGLEDERPAAIVVDMPEQGLDAASQQSLMAHLRRRGPGARPLFMLTRSCAILDLAAVDGDEAIILCPANHGPPIRVMPYPGAPGYEAVATCLASPEVRKRTEGIVAFRPHRA